VSLPDRGKTIPRPSKSIIPPERIERGILLIRGHRVLLRPDLAKLYAVEPRALVQAVKRNMERFPRDFMFQLSPLEMANLKSQSVISSWGGARRARPYAFTEQGVAMLSSVLRGKRAVAVNIEIMRAFVRLRQLMAGHSDLARRFDDLERKFDDQFAIVFDAIRALIAEPDDADKPKIGYLTESGRD
jgi:hypothetical protein